MCIFYLIRREGAEEDEEESTNGDNVLTLVAEKYLNPLHCSVEVVFGRRQA